MVWNAKSTAVAAVSGSSPRTLKIRERATSRHRAGSYPYPQQVSKVGSEDRGVSGLARKRVAADVPGLCEVKRCSVSVVNVESEFGPVPWPPAEPSCCEAPGAPVRARAMGLTTLSGTKTSNSGAQGPSTSAPMQNMAGGFVCDCGRSYALKTSLARHKKECGKNNAECRWCGTRFNTLAGTCQHERKAHFVQYQSDLAKALPQPESELMEKIAIVEARSINGIFYKEMMGLHGAGSISPASTNAGSLESASPKAGCSSSASPGPTTRSRAPTKSVPQRSSNSARIVVEAQVHTRAPPNTGETEVALRESRRTVPRLGHNPSRPCGISPLMAIAIDEDSVLSGLRVQAGPSPTAVHSVEAFPGTSSMTPMETDRVHNKSGIDPILEHNGTRQVRREESSTREDPVEQWSPNYPKTPVTMPNITTTADATFTSYNRTPQTLPGNRRRRSRSLPPVQRKSASDELESVDSLGPWAVFLQDQVDAGSLSGNDSLADLVRVALTKSDRGVLNDAVNRYLAQRAESLRIRKRGSKGKRKSKTGRHYGQTTSGSSQRAALFKKHQALFLKNRRGLAETILSGKGGFFPRPEPPVTSVEEFYGGIFESPSPPDNEPFEFRNVQPSAWRVLRTTLVPKDGDLRNPANWRPITISSALQRLLHGVLAARLSKLVSLSSSQRGFTEIDGTLANALILHEYLQYRRQTGRTYQVVSVDVRKAFDTVSHCSISRALGRFGIPSVIREYILATFGAQTTIKYGSVTTRPIRMLRGVRQGDPLSPVLFNLVMDELLEKVNEKYEGGSLQSGERCSIMAFADDLILIADRDQDVPAMFDEVSTFLERRGMSVNPAKCRTLIAGAVSGRSVVRTGSSYKIHNTPIPNVDALDAFKYLGLEFGHKGVERPTIHNLSVWLNNLRRAPLKPDQKCLFIRQYVIPRLLYGMQNPQVTSKVLREADRLIRRHLKTYYHLNVHTPDSLIHASVRDGGLGIMELRKAIPRIFLGRLVKLLNKNNDSVLSSVLQSNRVRTLMGKLSTMAGEVPESTFWRNRIASGPLSKGLEQAAEDSASRLWISEKPSGWSGRDHVRAVQLRTGNLPTKAIPSVPVGQRRCRHGCACDESISHVLQMCPLTHADRIRRHDEVVKKVARHCGAIVIADVQVSWDSESLTVPYERKRAKYDVPQFHQAAQHAWPGKALTFVPVIVGARGIWSRINNDRSAALQIPPVVRRACVNSVVKWGSSIHATFMSKRSRLDDGSNEEFDEVENIKAIKDDLRKILFNEANKCNKGAIEQILSRFEDLELVTMRLIKDNSFLEGRIKEMKVYSTTGEEIRNQREGGLVVPVSNNVVKSYAIVVKGKDDSESASKIKEKLMKVETDAKIQAVRQCRSWW
ncbi:Retrovirus-related Pol polyprotein from type-1 retrotransposable element R2-like Protein [Tribolium castaneum]|uniref:Retrovirus-related Pol polyprotein from type-1 retrotransposable element R2-like Protein n=1 Tax=Tribolium castaneum TaxID=7070 RepID=A0A139W9S8_TRICA|nr:Retrovirus-related Pol polyprotein from type-1 retrotransposable element R2-like Protein [Tribolium castaneum]